MIYYYVGCIDDTGRKRLLITGPYATGDAAESDIDRISREVKALYPNDQSFHWYTWSAARSEVRHEGQLNAALGFVPQL